MNEIKMPWFKRGDVDATIGVFFDGFTKIIVGVGVLTGVMKMSNEMVFGKLVSAIGLTAFLLLLFNTLYARWLGKKTGNAELTALPGGISGGTFFVWLYALLVPVYSQTGDAIYAWKVAINVNIIYSVLIIICAFIIKFIIQKIPSEAMLGSVVGGSMAYLLMTSLADGFSTPIVQIPALFMLIFLQFGRIKLKRFSPAFIAVGLGTVLAWVTGAMHFSDFTASFQNIGFYMPLPQLGLVGGKAFQAALSYLPIAFAYAFADVTALLQGVEQAEQSGEKYDPKICLLETGCVNLIGSFIGNPFPMNIYWGHPAWKKAKAGTSYPLFVGALYLVLCMTGLVAIATSAIPSAATLIMLIFVAITTGTQSYSVVNKKYYPAMIVATAIPIFEMLYGKVENGVSAASNAIGAAINSAGIDFDVSSVAVTQADLAGTGVSKGFFALGKGSMMIAILFACIMIFVIDRKWFQAGVSALVAAVCAFFGIIHSATVTANAAPVFMWIYIAIAVFFFIVHVLSKSRTELQPELEEVKVEEETKI